MQLDLFGEVEALEHSAATRHSENEAWAARFERADWVTPWPTSTGLPAGTVFHGYRCPDPECGEVEPTGFTLSINHGWDPELPGRKPWNARCQKVARRLSSEGRATA